MFKGWRRFKAHTPRVVSPVLPPESTTKLLQSLLEKTPGAVSAQRAMDAHPHSYHSNKERLYELIDFNDTFVSLVLALSPGERQGFIERLRVSMQQYCKNHGSAMFSDEQFDAITRGLSREVAVYLGARHEGFQVSMTSRVEDAMGVDMTITDPVSGRRLNIDCKASSAYYFRIKDLVSQGRLTDEEGRLAEEVGYVREMNGHGDDAVPVTILRIDPNEMGDIKDFVFTNPKLLGTRLHALFLEP